MKVLVAVMSCHAHRGLCDVQRRTWGSEIPDGLDVRWFVGGGVAQREDEVVVDAPDGYHSLVEKCRKIFQWALERGYDYVLKTDSDVYLRPERVLAAVPVGRDYVGRLRGPARGFPAPYCSGIGYWLSRKAMQARVESEGIGDSNEDLVTGNVLFRAGIHGELDNRYSICKSGRNMIGSREGVLRSNSTVLAGEYDEAGMLHAHKEWMEGKLSEEVFCTPEGEFERVDVLVKTFLRDGLMMKCVNGILSSLPGARVVLVDDGWESKEKVAFYSSLRRMGHSVTQLAFDSGYGAKNNEAARHYEREFVLRASDDFDFTPDAAEGVRKMIAVMDYDSRVGIASGRLGGKPYEFDLQVKVREDGLKEIKATHADLSSPLSTPDGVHYTTCSYTVNYSLVRTPLMKAHVWDEKFKMGGDHLDLYLTANEHQVLTAYVHGANIEPITPAVGDIDPSYAKYRGRARLALPWTFERHGWYSWQIGDGKIDTRESVRAWADSYKAGKPDRKVQRAIEREKRQKERLARRERMRLKRSSHQVAEGRYCIDPLYVERSFVPHFDATKVDEPWQEKVYELALKLYREKGLHGVMDFGCGNAEKLLRYFDGEKKLGVEVEPTLSWLRDNHPEHLFSETPLEGYDLCVCADVIEHVHDPDAFLDTIDKGDWKWLVISTPDRSLMPGVQVGPPKNKHHVREWTFKEFRWYLSTRYKVVYHEICDPEQFTQVAICIRKKV